MTGKLFAGFAKEDITPPKCVSLQGQYYERISTGINDRLYANVAALESEDGLDHCVMIALDLIGVEKIILDRLRESIKDEKDAPQPSRIMAWGIHNHTGPFVIDNTFENLNWTQWKIADPDTYMSPDQYLEFLTLKLKKAVLEAWRSKGRVKIGNTLGRAVVGHPRRVLYDDRSVMYGLVDTANFIGLESGSDSGIELMYFFDMEDKLKCIIANAACPAQVIEHMSVISADYFGAARRIIEKEYTEDIVFMPQISAAGDQSPRDLIRRGKSETTMNSIEGMEELGRRVAGAVIDGYEAARTNSLENICFNHVAKDILLPLRTVTIGEVESAEREYSFLMEKYSSEKEIYGTDLVKLVNIRAVLRRKQIQEKACFFKFEMHVLRIGECAFVTNPFELYIDYGFAIKARSRAVQTFVVQLCCASGAYLPTEKSIKGGSYGANVSNGVTGPEGGRLYVLHAVSEINRLFSDDGFVEDWRFGG